MMSAMALAGGADLHRQEVAGRRCEDREATVLQLRGSDLGSQASLDVSQLGVGRAFGGLLDM
jgi:hypothetical protein